jgi:hypothetical protein
MNNKVTIEHLEVKVEIEGNSDEAVFSRLFQKYINLWSRLEQEAKARACLARQNRSIGDQPEMEA